MSLIAARRFSMPLGVFAFWLGMSVAVFEFPGEYDWRYMTISVLLYPERNPIGHAWASAGLALCGLFGFIGSRGRGLLAGGYLCMLTSSLLLERMIPIPKGHEILAISAFICVCTGLMRLTSMGYRSRLLLAVPLIPMTMAALTQLYIDLFHGDYPWVGMAWRERGISPLLSFALWEWITCAVLSMYMAVAPCSIARRRSDGG